MLSQNPGAANAAANSSQISLSSALCTTPNQSQASQKINPKIGCIMPKDSTIIKEGELLKIGKRTGTMRARYYILRD